MKATVEELQLQNFRAFRNARLQLSDITFLIGKSGTGKSSILDAFDLLREAVTDNLENALERRGGLLKVRRMQHNLDTHRLGIGVVLSLGQHGKATYSFDVNEAYQIRECLRCYPKTSNYFKRDGEQLETSIKIKISPPQKNLILPLIANSDDTWDAVYNAVRNMRAYNISPSTMGASSDICQWTNLDKNGANAARALKAIEGTKDHLWIIQHLAAISGISNVRTEGHSLIFTQQQHDYDASQIAQGVLRSLGILLALRQKPTPSVVLVDEVEKSIHPSAISVLLEAAEASKDRTKIVFTTNSYEVLDYPTVSGDRVRVIWNDNGSTIYRLREDTIKSVNNLKTVGSMLRGNILFLNETPDTWTN